MLPRAIVTVLLLLGVQVLPAQDPPDRGGEKFQLALGLMQRSLHEEAGKQLEAFLKESPRHPAAKEAWYRLGVCRAETGQNEPAVAAFEKALKSGEAFDLRPECRYRLGQTYKALSRHAEAAGQFQKLVDEAGPAHYLAAASLFAAGEEWRDEKRLDDALLAFLACAKADTSKDGAHAAPALYAAGFIQLNSDHAALASTTFGTVADQFPAHAAAAECRYLQGEAALRAGDFDGAQRAFTAARAKGNDFADQALMGLARCKIDGGKPAEALPHLRELVKRHPDSPLVARAKLEIGRILYGQGKAEQAAKELGDLANGKVAPELMAPSLELRGVALLDAGKAAEAAPLFEQALAGVKDPAAMARLHYQLAEACAAQTQWERAATEYHAASSAADPALAGDAFYGEALALHRLGRFDQALERVRALVQAQRGHRLAVPARFAEAENLFALKRYAEADPVFAAIPADHALAHKAAFKRAWCAYLGGQAQEAAARFGTLASAAGDDPLAEESLSMAALASLQAGDDESALALADRYKARYRQGSFLGRTERVAGRVLKKKGNLRGAAERLASASSAAGASADEIATDRLQAAEILFQQGDFQGAREAYQKLAGGDGPQSARAIEGLAWCLFELDEDAACQREVARGLQHPQIGDLAAGLLELVTSLHVKHERWAEAEASAHGFLEKFPQHARAPEVSYAYGVALARGGKDDAARGVLAALAKSGGGSRPDRVQFELAAACRRLHDEAAAREAFRQAAALTKDEDLGGEARIEVGEALLQDKKHDAAREVFAQVKGKHQARALYRTGFSLLEEQRLADAAPVFESLAALGPGDLFHEALFLAGETRARLGQFEAAAPPLRQMLREAPDHPRVQAARQSLAAAELALNRPSEAVAAAEAFIAHDDGKDRAATARAELVIGRGRMALRDHANAEAALVKVTELSEGDLAAEAQYRLGESRRDRGDLEGAVDACLKLSILYTHPAWVAPGLLLAGRCYEDRQLSDKAKKLYAELLQRFPDTDSAKEAKTRLERLGGR